MGEILANMTQVSDVAPGPLVLVPSQQFFAKEVSQNQPSLWTGHIFLVPVLAGLEKFHCICLLSYLAPRIES
jgi:hypothetical protein